jgi:hypothetical protein
MRSSLSKSTLGAAFAAVLVSCVMPAAAQTKPIATGDVNAEGVVAEVTECKRGEGTLTLRIRLKNTGEKSVGFWAVSGRKYDDHYVTAGKKKYLILRDAQKVPLAPASDAGGNVRVSLKKGGVYTWWAKFPDPPADVKKVNYTWPIGSPIDDIPCTDS